jgi:hypothetical protein
MAAAAEPVVELPAAALFAINERVFVADPKHNGMMYEAKVRVTSRPYFHLIQAQ